MKFSRCLVGARLKTRLTQWVRLTRPMPDAARPGGTVARLRLECRGWGVSDAIYDQGVVQDVVLDGSSALLRSRSRCGTANFASEAIESPNDRMAIVAIDARGVRGDITNVATSAVQACHNEVGAIVRRDHWRIKTFGTVG